jgi:tRNA(Ile)-lysidine synthase
VQVAVAVSGGADSIALMLHAAQIFPPSDITALSVDHGTRTASRAERAYAAQTASRLGISFQVLAPPMTGYGHAHWRQIRLQTLVRSCASAGIGLLWLGHHGDDAVETAAIRLLADGPLHSLAGISGVSEMDGIRIERPLLKLSSRTIRRRLIANGFGWTEDPSNRNPAYKRSAVRRTLMGLGNQQDLIQRTARWRLDLERLERRTWAQVATATPLGSVLLKRSMFAALPFGLQMHLLRRATLLATGGPERIRQVDFIALASAMTTGPVGGALLMEDGENWCLARNPASIDTAVPLHDGAIWDQRFRARLSAQPPPGDWYIAAVNGYRIGAMAQLAAPPLLDALPAIFGAGGIVAIPNLGVWRGRTGPFWVQHLGISWMQADTRGNFELAC